MMHGYRYVRPGGDFEPKMTMFKKVKVNGDGENEIFTFLKVIRIDYISRIPYVLYENVET